MITLHVLDTSVNQMEGMHSDKRHPEHQSIWHWLPWKVVVKFLQEMEKWKKRIRLSARCLTGLTK